MSFEPPIAHADAVRGLWRSFVAGRLAHALVFTGPSGIGKFRAMRWFAAGLFCASGPGEPCGVCGPCKRFASGNHPDLFVLDAVAEGEEQIRVGRIARRDDEGKGHAIEDFLALRALEGGVRVVLVREAERMNEAAQNAFLKTLEEPTAGTLLVLESGAPGQLLATVRSRVVELQLEPLTRAATREVLEQTGLESEEASRLARFFPGSPGRAATMRALRALEMRELLRAAFARDLDAGAAGRSLWEVAGTFPGATPSARARSRVRVFLDLGLELLRDCARARAGIAPDALPHGDLVEHLDVGSAALLRWRMEVWLRARQDVDLNMSPESIVDRALAAASPQTLPSSATRAGGRT